MSTESKHTHTPGPWTVERIDRTHTNILDSARGVVQAKIDAVEQLRAQLSAAIAERDQLRELIMWALGEGGKFPGRPDDWDQRKYKPWYWWRKELRARFDAIGAIGALTSRPAAEAKEKP